MTLGLTGRVMIAVLGGVVVFSAILLAALLTVTFATFENVTRSNVLETDRALAAQASKRTQALAEVAADFLTDAMYFNDLTVIAGYAAAMRGQQGVAYVYVLDVAGEIVHDGTDTLESFGTSFDDDALRQVIGSGRALTWEAGGMMNAAAPIRFGPEPLGSVRLGVWLNQFQGDREAMHETLAAITRDGARDHVAISIVVALVLGAAGIGAGIFAVRNVTARRAAEAARTAMEGQLREMQKMEAIGKLTGGMAHDFNNYLGVIIGNLDMLKIVLGANAEAARLAEAALDGALRGAELTRSLLSFARRQPLRPKRVDVARNIDAIGAMLRRTLGEDVALTATAAPGLWPIHIDSAQLDSCIVNLANNARDAMPKGGILVLAASNVRVDAAADLHPELKPGDYVLIEMADTGAGMAPEVLAQVFEPFFSTKPVGHGTGLGLSMVHGFVKQSGGHIEIDSLPGRGTTVRIYLPRLNEAAAAKSVRAA